MERAVGVGELPEVVTLVIFAGARDRRPSSRSTTLDMVLWVMGVPTQRLHLACRVRAFRPRDRDWNSVRPMSNRDSRARLIAPRCESTWSGCCAIADQLAVLRGPAMPEFEFMT